MPSDVRLVAIIFVDVNQSLKLQECHFWVDQGVAFGFGESSLDRVGLLGLLLQRAQLLAAWIIRIVFEKTRDAGFAGFETFHIPASSGGFNLFEQLVRA